MDTLNLTKFFTTTSQSRLFTESLSRISEKVYSTDFDLERSLSEQLSLVKKDLFLQLLQENSISIHSKAAIKKFIDDVIAKVNTLPILTLTIAIEPNEQLLKAITDWCELNIGSQVILALKVDPKLIAGTTMMFAGKFFDFSVKPVFEQIATQSLQSQTHQEHQQPEKTQTLSNID